jgi:glucokinase
LLPDATQTQPNATQRNDAQARTKNKNNGHHNKKKQSTISAPIPTAPQRGGFFLCAGLVRYTPPMTTTLVADIGGTHTRCALTDAGGRLGPVTVFRNAGFAGPAEVLDAFLEAAGARPAAAALAVAAPIAGDEVAMINIGWRFSRGALRERLGLRSLSVINDFAALAWALRELGPADVAPVGGGAAVAERPRVVLGPGTGLGVASLVRGAGGWTAVPGEGGHVTLAASDDAEEAVIRAVRARFGHCSAERLVSGPGLALLHAALHDGETATPEELGQRYADGEAKAAASFAMFFRLLGTVASNAALTLGAAGGVYIAGGIVPRYLAAFLRSGFRERFEAKGRYRGYLTAIPTFVITAEHAALRGLAAVAHAPA